MVQAKTSDFQPLPLKILNVLSLLAGASLLVAVSWEILLGDPRHYSTDYLLLQGIVCVVFLADFFARMWMADHSWRFFFRNLYFFLLSVPYLNIVDWMGIELSHAEAMLMGLVPLLRALLGLYVLFTWIINNRVTRLLTSYVLSMLVFTYFAALIFYDYEIEVNPALHDFGDAIWWNYGAFIQQCVDFAILAFCVFLMVKMMNKLMKKKQEAAPAPVPEPSKEELLLTEIRDLLREQKK